MAEESNALFKTIIDSLTINNGLLQRVASNTEMSADLAIENSATAETSQNSAKIASNIESCVAAIYDHLDQYMGPDFQFNIGMLLPMKQTLDRISERIKIVMEDMARTALVVGESLDLARKESVKKSKIVGKVEKTTRSKSQDSGEDISFEKEERSTRFKIIKASSLFAVDIAKVIGSTTISISKAIGSIGSSLSKAMSTLAKDMYKALKLDKVLAKIKDKIGEFAERLASKTKALLRITGIDKAFGALKDTLSSFGKGIASKTKDFLRVTGIGNAVGKAAKSVGKVFKPVGNVIGGVAKKILPGLKGIGKALAPGLKGVGSALNKIPLVGKITDIGRAMGDRMFQKDDKKKKKDDKKKKKGDVEKPEKKSPKLKKDDGILGTVSGVVKGLGNIAKGVGKTIKDVMINIAEGVKAFGDSKVLKGAASLLILGAALFVTVKALQEFASVNWGDMAKGGVALIALAGIAMVLGKMQGDILKGSLAILALSGATWIAAKAFQEFASVDWGSVFIGMGALALLAVGALLLGNAIVPIALGAAAIALLGLALIPFAVAAAIAGFAMKELADAMEKMATIDFKSFVKIAGGLFIIGGAALALGLMSPFIIAASVALLALGLALIPLAAAMSLAAPSMDTFADGLKKLADIGGGNLLSVAAGIAAVGLAMAAFGAGQAAAGLGNLVSKFLTLGSDSPVEQLIKIGAAGDGIEKAAAGISKISEALEGLSKLSADSMAAINDFPWLKATAFAAVGGQMSAGGVSVGKLSVDKPAPGDAESNTSGATMNALQSDTAQANADSQSAPIIMPSGSGSGGSSNTTVSSVSYASNNIPDRTAWQMTPAFGY